MWLVSFLLVRILANYSCNSFLGNILPLNSRHASAGVIGRSATYLSTATELVEFYIIILRSSSI
nr:MAG TPA: hypothetical protein [Caudoviricetes sp.]DAW18163.1 MAG TPA: hypothetical protein [Caudoviricetes sp.]